MRKNPQNINVFYIIHYKWTLLVTKLEKAVCFYVLLLKMRDFK